ncbi:MAG: glycerate kinase [Gordonia sp. (in: high G+C Gram-positive bacteria)]|uniref:glycerate kinase family protein n=1 Tax=Gordonia sp. (in: high G+C Gram-positive bacteria) TaxID=84139 RepID=UPI003BB51932
MMKRANVVVMPDSFGETLTAVEAAASIGAGWHAARATDVVTLAPQSDGGPGFIEVLATAFGGEVRTQTVTGPLGEPTRAQWLLHNRVAYLEAAQACGLHLVPVPRTPQSALSASSAGVGDLISAALQAGCTRIVVGLGGTAATDGGRGAAERLGGIVAERSGGVHSAARLLHDVEVIAATDVDNPLLGLTGAAAVYAPQKGADSVTVELLEARLAEWADELTRQSGRDVRDEPGAGAAGGLGAFLLSCGAHRESGAAVVAAETGRRAAIAAADLVITGEGAIDDQTCHGKVVAAIAAEAAQAGVPVLVLAGQSQLTDAEAAAFGEVHALVDYAQSVDDAKQHAGPLLTELAGELASQWTFPGVAEVAQNGQ